MTEDQNLIRTLAYLRNFAVCGQLVALLLAQYALQLSLNSAALGGGIAALLVFNAYVWLVHKPNVQGRSAAKRIALHLALDIAQLTWMLAWSGGAMNPFVSLLLVPVAVATLALPVRWIWGVATMAAVAYAVSAALGSYLPHIHGLMLLHLWGMAANFAVTTLIFVLILTRLARSRDARERELAELRVHASNARGVTRLATHAAAMAHSLNTPLGTLTLLLDDLVLDVRKLEPVPIECAQDIQRAQELVSICQNQVRALVQDADGEHTPQALQELVAQTLTRWQLLRPAIQLEKTLSLDLHAACSIVQSAELAHLLHALMDNAADASSANQENLVRLSLHTDAAEMLHGQVSDCGGDDACAPHLDSEHVRFQSQKPHGLGLGLAVCQLSISQWGGSMAFDKASNGLIARFSIPLTALRRAAHATHL